MWLQESSLYPGCTGKTEKMETRDTGSPPATFKFQPVSFHLLTCGRAAAGSVPGWCCRRWRPVSDWCCTHPPPPLSCCLAGRATAAAAALLPWSLTGWRPWHWGIQKENECRELSRFSFVFFSQFGVVGGESWSEERRPDRLKPSLSSQSLWAEVRTSPPLSSSSSSLHLRTQQSKHERWLKDQLVSFHEPLCSNTWSFCLRINWTFIVLGLYEFLPPGETHKSSYRLVFADLFFNGWNINRTQWNTERCLTTQHKLCITFTAKLNKQQLLTWRAGRKTSSRRKTIRMQTVDEELYWFTLFMSPVLSVCC